MRSRRSAGSTSSSRRVGGSGLSVDRMTRDEHRARIARACQRSGDRPAELGRQRPLLADDERVGASTRSKKRSETGRRSRIARPDPVAVAARARRQARAAASSRSSRRPAALEPVVDRQLVAVQADPALVPDAGAARHGRDELVLRRLEQLDARQRAGPERAPELELVAVDRDGRVGARAAEPVALGAGLVRRRARIDDDGAAVDPELERERVGVGVRRQVRRRRRAAVEREPDARRAHDGVARCPRRATRPSSAARQLERGRQVERRRR